ncbi:MAG: glycosyltransferase family 39 protein [Rikenellaceae bacterium]
MKSKFYIYILPLLAIIPIFIFRDYTPDNELRYISIIEEALRNGSLFAFHNQGVAYADKPPLYFWLLMACRHITGENIMLLIGLFTLIPTVVIFYVMNNLSFGKHENVKATPILMLLTSVMFIGSALVIRMDMLMVMFIILALYNFYRIYTKTNNKWDSYFLPLNIFLALFTKGPVGLLAPIVAIAVFLFSEHKLKDFGHYLGLKQWTIIVSLAAIWFTGVALEGGSEYVNNLLFKQTIGRGINSFHHKEPFYYYLQTIWYTAAPWSLLCVVVMIKGFQKRIIQHNTLLKFYSVIILSTLVTLSLISSKIDIYLLPIYPFLIYLTVLLLKEIKIDWVIKSSIFLPSIILFLTPLSLLFDDVLLPIIPPNMWLIYLGIIILCLGGFCGAVFALKGHIKKASLSISTSLLVAIFVMSFTVPYFNDIIGFRNMSLTAKKAAMENGITSYAFYQFRGGENMDVFLKTKLKQVKDMKELKTIHETIFFVREKDINSQDSLKEFLRHTPMIKKVGDFEIYIIK